MGDVLASRDENVRLQRSVCGEDDVERGHDDPQAAVPACRLQQHDELDDGGLVRVGRCRTHEQHPVEQLIAMSVLGQVLEVGVGERPAPGQAVRGSGHDTHRAPFDP